MNIPEAYRGREASYVKHRLLETYLEKLFMIIGQHSTNICYVDCFAGPWQEKSEDLSDTSIAISLDIMRKSREGLRKIFNRDVRFRAFFIEKDRQAFDKLEKYLSTNQSDGISAEAKHGEFLSLRNGILRWCGKDFTFFFVDPKGWQDVGIPNLRPILQRGNSEYLINFMYDFISRFHQVESQKEDMEALFGEVPNTEGLPPKVKENRLLRLYREKLKLEAGADARTARVQVLAPLKDRTKYDLVYLTKHPLGIIKFMEASEELELIQSEIRAQAKQNRRVEKTRQEEFFAAKDLLPTKPETNYNVEAVKEFWLKQLTTTPKKFGRDQLADMLEETDWFERDFQDAFRELLSEGKVENLDMKRKRPKNSVNFDQGEKLKLL